MIFKAQIISFISFSFSDFLLTCIVVFALILLHFLSMWINNMFLKLNTVQKGLQTKSVSHCSGLVHWEDPEGWDGEGGGRGRSGWGTHVNPWPIHVNVWQKQLQYCKVISLQLIKINGKKKCLSSYSFYSISILHSFHLILTVYGQHISLICGLSFLRFWTKDKRYLYFFVIFFFYATT